MTAGFGNIIKQYQGVAPNSVLNAVAKASKATGANFSFLMKKAATESSFNPSAKAKSSTATGLFQFIENTWLSMVKKHGDKYGLGALAAKIEMKDGRPCVTDCSAKKEILDLRKNPEISALMAGEFSAENQRYLENNTDDQIGETELYLAHFMGAQGAAKFLNARAEDPEQIAAEIFPREAAANKNVFFDQDTGEARTLDDVYSLMNDKFTCKTTQPLAKQTMPRKPSADFGFAKTPAASALLPLILAAPQASSSNDIIWSDDPRYASFGFGRSYAQNKIAAPSFMTLLEAQTLSYNS